MKDAILKIELIADDQHTKWVYYWTKCENGNFIYGCRLYEDNEPEPLLLGIPIKNTKRGLTFVSFRLGPKGVNYFLDRGTHVFTDLNVLED